MAVALHSHGEAGVAWLWLCTAMWRLVWHGCGVAQPCGGRRGGGRIHEVAQRFACGEPEGGSSIPFSRPQRGRGVVAVATGWSPPQADGTRGSRVPTGRPPRTGRRNRPLERARRAAQSQLVQTHPSPAPDGALSIAQGAQPWARRPPSRQSPPRRTKEPLNRQPSEGARDLVESLLRLHVRGLRELQAQRHRALLMGVGDAHRDRPSRVEVLTNLSPAARRRRLLESPRRSRCSSDVAREGGRCQPGC